MTNHPAYQNKQADMEVYKRLRAELEAAAARVENAIQGALHLNGINRFLPYFLTDAQENLRGAIRNIDRRLGVIKEN